jgi:acyl-CoA thioesterase-1
MQITLRLMTRSLLCKIRVVLVLVSPLWLLLAACKNPSGRATENGEPAQKGTPMQASSPSNSPMMTGPIIYLALGDSTGSGVGANEGGYVARLFKRIVTHRPGSELINLCVSGATTSDVLSDQLDSGVRATPQLVTLGIGINDIGHGLSLEQFSRNYEEILARLKNNTRTTIVVTNIPDISSAPRIPAAMRGEYHQLIVEFNRRLAEIAAAHGVIVFDVYTVTHQLLPSHPEYFSGDGFHPSDKGYELWAEQMWPTIAQTIGVDAAATSISR